MRRLRRCSRRSGRYRSVECSAARKGIYARGIIFALELRGELMLKGDDESAPLLEEAGARRWCYEGRSGKPVAMPYWTIPDEALDDPDIMAKWARIALDAAMRVTEREAAQRR